MLLTNKQTDTQRENKQTNAIKSKNVTSFMQMII